MRRIFTAFLFFVSKVSGHIPITTLTIVNSGGTIVPQRIDAVLDVSRENTDNHDRDSDLQGATYFDTAQYPDMKFQSTSIERIDASSFRVNGNLTIKNVTKPVTFTTNVVGIVPDRSGWRVGYNAQLSIDRRDWGINDAKLTPAGVLLVDERSEPARDDLAGSSRPLTISRGNARDRHAYRGLRTPAWPRTSPSRPAARRRSA